MTKARLRAYCDAEFENIKAVVHELKKVYKEDKSIYTVAELAAMATFLHNVYNGWENILKRCLMMRKMRIQDGHAWHKDLLQAALREGLVDADLHGKLAMYLSFRHFFVHSYSFALKWTELEPLVKNLHDTLRIFQASISRHI